MSDMILRLNTALEGRYRIAREVGEGGMATVYLAEDLRHKRNVALKVLKPELAAVVGAERFLAEIETTANLQHPHILPLFDSGEADGFLFYVMPYVDGETLRDRIDREKQLPVDEAVRIATAVGNALDYAHEEGVIHRDIKPANILLSRGEPLVADFGIALAVSAAGGGRLTETGLSVGTPYYMSPEQASADRDPSPASDVYSLGCVLYEMLVGEPPHTGSSAQAVLAKILTDLPAAPRAMRATVPPNVDAAVRKSLEKLPADRFPTAAAFVRAIADPQFTHGALADLAGATGSPTRGWGRAAAGVVLGTLVGALGVALAGGAFDEPEALGVSRVAVSLAPEEVLAPGPAYNASFLGPALAMSLDGRRFVYVGPSGDDGYQLWLKERDQVRPRPVPGTEGAFQPFFAPDGARVGYVQRDEREIRVVSLDGRPPLTVAEGSLLRLGASWAVDDWIYFSEQPQGELARVPGGGGAREILTAVDTAAGHARHAWPDALPNGRGVLITIEKIPNGRSEEDEVAVVDLETREVHPLVVGAMGRYVQSGHLLFVQYDGTLMAVAFDQDRLEISGSPVPLIDAILPSKGPDLAVSSRGHMVYATSSSSSTNVVSPDELVWVDRAGSASVVDSTWFANFSTLALSPSGDRLAVTTRGRNGNTLDTHIWIKAFDGGSPQRLTFEGPENFDPFWTPDGESVVFSSNRLGGWDLFIKPADGSGNARLLLDDEVDVYQPVVSGDGQWLAFTRGAGGADQDIYSMRFDGSEPPVPVAAMPGLMEQRAALSPDGRWLAYYSNESGRGEVWVRSFPSGEPRWQVSTEGGQIPRWSRDGRELLLRVGRSSWEMRSVDVEPGTTFVRGQERTLFDWAGLDNDRWDVGRSDQGFIFVRPRADVAEFSYEFVLVENLIAELNVRLPN